MKLEVVDLTDQRIQKWPHCVRYLHMIFNDPLFAHQLLMGYFI